MSENLAPSVFGIDIKRGTDGVLRCKFASKLLAGICESLAERKKKTVSLGDKNYEIWDCEDDLLSFADEMGVGKADEGLLTYRNGKIEGISMVPLCAVALGESAGLTIEPAYPYSALALNAYAKAVQGVVRSALASVAPVEISVKLMVKKAESQKADK